MDKTVNLDDLLLNFHESTERVHSINNKIKAQIKEMSKTKLLLDKCHHCLSLQNNMLNKLEIEKRKVFDNNNELIKYPDKSVALTVSDKYSISHRLNVEEKSDPTKKELFNNLMLSSVTNSNVEVEVIKSGEGKKIIIEKKQLNVMKDENKEKQMGENSVTSVIKSERSQIESIKNIEVKLSNCSSFQMGTLEPKLEIFEFDKSVYGSIERTMMHKYTSQKVLKLKFENQTQIPNEMKFPNSSKRKMFLAVLDEEKTHDITGVFGQLSCVGSSDNVFIHIINKDMDVLFDEIDENLFVTSESSLQIKNVNRWKSKIKLNPRSVPAIVVLEEILPESPLEIPKQPIDAWTYYDGEEDEISRMSFTRYPVSNLAEELRFIATACVGLRHEVTPVGTVEKALCLVTIVNYAGKIIINTIVTPRLPVKHYNNHDNGLGSLQFLNQMDEYDCIREVRKLLDKKIVVGHNVLESLALLKMPLERILGIRDLSNAICFHKMRLFKRHGYYRLSYLKKELLPRQTFRSNDLITLQDATTVRLIYRVIENRWEDNKYPETGNIFGSLDHAMKPPQNEASRETNENSKTPAQEVIIFKGMQPRQCEEFLKITDLENFRLQSATYNDPSGKTVKVEFRD